MKRELGLLAMLICTSSLYAAEAGIGIGAVVPDNENVESAVVGKAEVEANIGQYLSFGVSAGQTGDFKQDTIPQEVRFANANPKAFGAKSYKPHDGDVIIIDNSDVTTIINTFPASNPLPKRPMDLTERNFWFAEPYVKIGFGVKRFYPYAKAFLGASGVKSYDGESRIGLSKGAGGGLGVYFHGVHASVEAIRRLIDTNVNSYGNWQYSANVGVGF